MKSVLKICYINSAEDVNRIREAVSINQGVVACQVNKEKSEVSIVYDDYFINIDCLMNCIEDIGYTIL